MEFDVRDNQVSFPLWSSEYRIVRLKKLNPDLLDDYSPREISLEFFKKVLVPIPKDKERMVAVNLSGKNRSGFDMSVDSLVGQVEAFF